jgi:hypothetical protein
MMARRALVLAALLLIAGGAHAVCGDYPGLCFDSSTLMTPHAGFNNMRVQNTSSLPGLLGPAGEDNACVAGDFISGGSCGAMRTACQISHMATTDPLIAPGDPNGSHVHTFMGNISIDEDTDVTVDLVTGAANTTCKGGIANRSAYWFPSMIDVRTGAVVKPQDSAFDGAGVYYKTIAVGATRINAFPRTFRMIAGAATSTAPQTNVDYRCSGDGAPGGIVSSFIDLPFCGSTRDMIMSVSFPQCAALDGEAPFGTLSGSYLADWKPIPTFWQLMYFEGVAAGDITNLVVTAGGGYTAPTVVTDREGTSTLKERAHIVLTDMTAGQWVEVASRRYTSTGASTALQIAHALQGGSPETNSPDHKSHISFQGNNDPKIGCPDAFPYALPMVQLEVHYKASTEEQQRAWRLSSDKYKGKPGYSGHGDFIFAWDNDIHRAWVLGCDRTGGDCHSNLLGCKDPTTGEETQCRKISF